MPKLTEADESAFDALLDARPTAATSTTTSRSRSGWFLHHLVRARLRRCTARTSRRSSEFRTRQKFDAHDVPIDAVFASDDAIWPIYFAVVNRPVAQSYINWCEHVGDASRYLFSIGSRSGRRASWTTGTIYVLPRDTFEPTPESRELVSRVPVHPRARLPSTRTTSRSAGEPWSTDRGNTTHCHAASRARRHR